MPIPEELIIMPAAIDLARTMMEGATQQSEPVPLQNRRQKVFNRGALHFCGRALGLCGGGALTQKINQNSTDL